MRWLVTGAAGYIGSKLVRELLGNGHRVVATDTFRHGNQHALAGCFDHDHFEFHRVDSRDVGSVAAFASSCDVVVPLAALVGAPICDKNPAETVAVNRDAVVGLVKAMSPNQILLAPTTNSGYGSKPGRECVEDDPLEPVSLYGTSKAEAEKAVLDHPNGVSLRLATVFGVSHRMRFDLLANNFCAALAQGRDLILFEGHFRRNFVHVSDVCEAFRWAARRKLRGVYNCGNPDANMTKRQLADRVCKLLGLPATRVREGDGRDPDRRDYLVSNHKLIATGFTFVTSLEEGLAGVAALARNLTPEETASMGNA